MFVQTHTCLFEGHSYSSSEMSLHLCNSFSQSIDCIDLKSLHSIRYIANDNIKSNNSMNNMEKEDIVVDIGTHFEFLHITIIVVYSL